MVMDKKRLTMEGQLEHYDGQLKSLNSYIKELTDRTQEYGTDTAQFETDLLEAQNNVKYYEGELARVSEELADADKTTGKSQDTSTILPFGVKPSLGLLILSSVSFVAGAILGSKLGFGSRSQDSPDE
jgi:chromosome segregation ATPase